MKAARWLLHYLGELLLRWLSWLLLRWWRLEQRLRKPRRRS